jgi:4-alpha-glucanotransferase
VLEPVVVVWDGQAVDVTLRLPAAAPMRAQATLRLEDGSLRALSGKLSAPRGADLVRVEGERFALRRLRLPAGLPQGYHRLDVELAQGRHAAHVISAPTRASAPRAPAAARAGRLWGAFLPLYALHGRRSWAAGDLTDFAALRRWLAERGADLVATLPLLAAFLDEPCQPSPYLPASRRFWNEFYLDPTSLPEFERCAPARALAGSAEMQRELERLRGGSVVPWKRAAAARRAVVQRLADACFARGGRERAALEAHVASHPLLLRYARFRALAEQRRESWARWPAALRESALAAPAAGAGAQADERGLRYHLYAQWRTAQALARLARDGGPGLYLDLPLGTHPDGFDAWAERAVFAQGVSGGAPPDDFFTQGQDWGFPPLHPERIREQGHRYFAECVRHHLAVAAVLRIDHVMGLHRLFWIPHGAPATEGTYVEQPAEELYAVLALESARSGALVVGEDLGTVPPGVRPALVRHGMLRTHVIQCELSPAARARLPVTQPGSLATLNTHDMPPFASFLRGGDIVDRAERGLLDDAQARAERRRRQRQVAALVAALRRGGWLKRSGRAQAAPGPEELLEAALAWLGANRARIAIVNLEDLWGETRPQNTPGTTTERANWQLRARRTLEQFTKDRRVLAALARVRDGRGGGLARRRYGTSMLR